MGNFRVLSVKAWLFNYMNPRKHSYLDIYPSWIQTNNYVDQIINVHNVGSFTCTIFWILIGRKESQKSSSGMSHFSWLTLLNYIRQKMKVNEFIHDYSRIPLLLVWTFFLYFYAPSIRIFLWLSHRNSQIILKWQHLS